MEKYSCYEFEIIKVLVKIENQIEKYGYMYKIYYWHDYYACQEYIESDEWYETESQANKAAIGHIDRLENGEG